MTMIYYYFRTLIAISLLGPKFYPSPYDSGRFADNEILPGKKLPPECHAELHTDFDGAAVRWGLTHHQESAYDCCMACMNQAKNAKPGQKRCNIWVYCPSETGCYSPDRYEHKNQECWLKYVSIRCTHHREIDYPLHVF